MMQGLRRCSNDVVRLDLRPATASSSSLSIDVAESAETRIRRLISEHPVIIFSRTSCCMCHVMKKLLLTIGVHPTVIQLDDDEIQALPSSPEGSAHSNPAPAVFIGGSCIGGLESLVGLHLSGHLVPKLVEIGALWKDGEEAKLSIPALRRSKYVCYFRHKTWRITAKHRHKLIQSVPTKSWWVPFQIIESAEAVEFLLG